ncbi:MAG: DMT family transporter [Gammaproteobacteria bacterium]
MTDYTPHLPPSSPPPANKRHKQTKKQQHNNGQKAEILVIECQNKMTTPAANKARRKAEWMLLMATVFWGWTFPVIKEAISEIPVFAFLAVRFALSALCMLPMAGAAGGMPSMQTTKTGIWLGILLFGVFALQTWGLVYTSSANSAFITGFYLIWVMLAAARDRRALISVLLAVGGLWFLTSPADGGINTGDWLTLGCSVFIAWHLLILSRLPEAASSAQLAAAQFAVVALLSLLCSLIWEDFRWQWRADWLFAFLLTSLGATVFAFWAQTHFQRRTTPIRAGVILVMESVFALLFAAALYKEPLTPTALIGCGLMLTAMLTTIIRK